MSRLSVLATFGDPAAGMRITARTGSGFDLVYDTEESGEARAGASPIETVLGALAACTALDVASILRKKRQAATGYQIAVSGERSDEHPRVYTSIVVEHRVSGAVDAEAVRRSVELSATRYCPVSAMLSASVRIEHRYRLVDEGAGAEGAGAEPESTLVVVTGPG